MSMYENLMIWWLPFCIPIGIAAVSAFAARSRIVFVVPVVISLLCIGGNPPPRVYSEYAPGTDPWLILREDTVRESEHMREVAFWSGLLSTLFTLIVLEVSRSSIFTRRSNRKAAQTNSE